MYVSEGRPLENHAANVTVVFEVSFLVTVPGEYTLLAYVQHTGLQGDWAQCHTYGMYKLKGIALAFQGQVLNAPIDTRPFCVDSNSIKVGAFVPLSCVNEALKSKYSSSFYIHRSWRSADERMQQIVDSSSPSMCSTWLVSNYTYEPNQCKLKLFTPQVTLRELDKDNSSFGTLNKSRSTEPRQLRIVVLGDSTARVMAQELCANFDESPIGKEVYTVSGTKEKQHKTFRCSFRNRVFVHYFARTDRMGPNPKYIDDEKAWSGFFKKKFVYDDVDLVIVSLHAHYYQLKDLKNYDSTCKQAADAEIKSYDRFFKFLRASDADYKNAVVAWLHSFSKIDGIGAGVDANGNKLNTKEGSLCSTSLAQGYAEDSIAKIVKKDQRSIAVDFSHAFSAAMRTEKPFDGVHHYFWTDSVSRVLANVILNLYAAKMVELQGGPAD